MKNKLLISADETRRKIRKMNEELFLLIDAMNSAEYDRLSFTNKIPYKFRLNWLKRKKVILSKKINYII